MDFTLRCNILKCRKELSGHAVVTTCSHVFCIECSNACQLNGARDGEFSTCPACDGQLRNPDDVVVTNLNPTEDYKTSVLSGLSPSIIMECAGRALSWWAYQATQEMFVTIQKYLLKNLGGKYAALNLQMDKIIHNANSEISNLRNLMSSLQIEKESLRNKNDELSQAFREKCRKQLQTQETLDKIKRRSMLGHVQNAASDAVEHSFQASVAANRYVDSLDRTQRPPPPPLFAARQQSNPQNQSLGNPTVIAPQNLGTWNGYDGQEPRQGGSQLASQGSQPIQSGTTHRQPLGNNNPQAPSRTANFQANSVSGTPMVHSARRPLSNLNPNNAGGSAFAGYGMSAGVKVSNGSGTSGNLGVGPPLRSRVAQRSASIPGGRDSAFTPQNPNMFNRGSGYY
ncbi:hypothetical protein HYALB_00002612 [Hymenoscyphus albidus]|uniref:RING-type domain-containing protein n=1 Tax=Hymenoscyphus albidus TaxID=595503 RepID=A0A9N9LVF9_9HELO|nr:hypothetical protein HYALB_00002612 [Hymenoscyphus albidus]